MDLALAASHVHVVPICGVGMISSIVSPQSSLMISEFY